MTNKNLFTLFILLMGMSSQIFAQGFGTIYGVVSDSVKNEPLFNATISASGKYAGADFETGAYEIQLPVGSHTLEFSFVGYKNKKYILDIKENDRIELNVQMNETSTLIERITVKSTKFEKPISEITVSMEVLSPDLLKNTGTVAVNQALEKVPGVTMLGDQADIRGGAGWAQGTGSRVLVLMDDMPAYQADGGLVYWRDLPTENMAQVEVLKGAASTLYGSAALNGVINIRTAYPVKKPFTQISVFHTMYGNPSDANNKWWTAKNAPFESGIQFAHRRKIKKFELVSGGNIFYNSSFMRGGDNPYNEPELNDTLPAYDRKGRLTVNMKYRLNERIAFGLNTTVNVGWQNQYLFWARDTTYGLYQSEITSVPIRGRTFRMTVDPSVSIRDKYNNKHKFQSRYYRIVNDNENNQGNSSHHVYGEYQFASKFNKLGNLELVTGAVGSFTAVDAEVYGNEQFTLMNFGAYVELSKKFFDRLSLTAGVRLEVNDMRSPDTVSVGFTPDGQPRNVASPNQFEGKPIMRFGANYKITEGTFFRASWGQGYRYPTLLERYVSTSAGSFLGVFPNPSLQSETGWSAEIGIKQGFKISKWQGFVDLAGFWTEYQNMMEFQFMNDNLTEPEGYIYGFQVNNVGDTRIRGVDFSVAGQGSFGDVKMSLLAGYTYIDPKYKDFMSDSTFREGIIANSTSENNILKYRYRHTAKFDGQLTYKGFTLGATFMYLSFMEAMDQYVYDNFVSIQKFRTENNKGSFMLNARIAYEMKIKETNVKLSLFGQNLLNNEYALRPGILEAPINWTIRADVNF
ncbi:MAG: TonB-dependent receptor [Saprospiraceae bacterium]|nr:TonB-dependent receptor [Saprospiraceae bacterium]